MFPKVCPTFTIKPIIDSFEVDYPELRWFFMKPVKDFKRTWATYDDNTLTSISKVEMTGEANIHGISCIEFSMTDYNEEEKNWYDEEVYYYARLTDTHVQWAGEQSNEGNIKRIRTFLDDDFIRDMGSIEPITGDERLLKDEAKYQMIEDEIKTIDEKKSNGFGFFEITINNKTYSCIRILDQREGILIEAYISKEGQMILWRRYNEKNWKDLAWDKQFPHHNVILIDGKTYIHWYDCLIDEIICNHNA